MKTYEVVVHQRVRYVVMVDAETPEAAAKTIEAGFWDDTDNDVLGDRVAVYDPADATVDPAPLYMVDSGYEE